MRPDVYLPFQINGKTKGSLWINTESSPQIENIVRANSSVKLYLNGKTIKKSLLYRGN